MGDMNKTKENWDLSPLFAGDQDPKMAGARGDIERATKDFAERWKKRPDYLKEPKVLRQALDEFENWAKNFGTEGKESFYFGLKLAKDQSNPELRAKENKIKEFGDNLSDHIRFFTLTLSKVSPAIQKKFLNAPELVPYKHFLEKIFADGKYTLSEQEERILDLKSDVSYGNWVQLTSSLLAKETATVAGKDRSFAEIMSLISHEKKAVRDQAAKSLNQIFAKYADVAEAEMNSVLSNHRTGDKLRGFKNPEDSRLLSDDMQPAEVEALATAVTKNFSLTKRYYALKAKLLGKKRLAYHERNVPIGKLSKELPLPEAIKLTRNSLAKFDNDFAEIFDRFLQNGQLDFWPKPGKVSGAFCASGMFSTPTYILLNYTGRSTDAQTIAHEMGHAINYEYIRRKQHALYFGTSLAIAETASTLMEDFVLEELSKDLKKPDDKLAVLMSQLNDSVSTIFRQIAAFRFEQELHKNFRAKGYLSKEEIGRLFQKHMSAYMGPAVEQSAGSENWWVYWSHLRNYFYNYSYASGLLTSKVFQAEFRKDKNFIEKIKTFLATGESLSPRDTLKNIGFDMTNPDFWQIGLKEVERDLKEAEKLTKK